MSNRKETDADLIRDPRIKKGVRVLVVASHATLSSDKETKEKIIGYTGLIKYAYENPKDTLPYTIEFDNELIKSIGDEFYWRTTEVMYLEDQSYVK